MTRTRGLGVLSALALALVLAATGAVVPVASSIRPAAAASAWASECPVKALARARDKPVEIVMWHSMSQANEDTLRQLTDRYNGSVRTALVAYNWGLGRIDAISGVRRLTTSKSSSDSST